MDISNWTKDDYRTFVLLYAANVDGELQEEEMELIESLEGEKRVKEIHKIASKLSDYECLNLFENEREKYYPGEAGKEELLKELSTLFKSDGKFTQFEQVVLRNLKRVL